MDHSGPSTFSRWELQRCLHAISPRWTRPATPLPSVLIHGFVFIAWIILLGNAFLGRGIFTWSVGIVYILYDTSLLLFTFVQTWPLRHANARPPATGRRPAVTAIITAYNEASVLAATIDALLRQSEPPEQITGSRMMVPPIRRI